MSQGTTSLIRRETIAFSRIHRPLLIALIVSILLVTGCSHAPKGHIHEGPWKFAFVSDTQGDYRIENDKSCINTHVVETIAADIALEKPDFVLVGGDLVNGWHRNGGTSPRVQFKNWKRAMAPVYKAGIRVYPVRGNHETGPDRVALPPLPAIFEPAPGALDALEKAYWNAFPKAYKYIPRNGPPGEEGFTYSFTHKNAFIVAVDQYGSHPHRVNQEWVEAELAGNVKPHIFLFGHEPAFGLRHKDNLGFYPEDRDRLWDAFVRAGGRVYLCGHDHLYDRGLIEDKVGIRAWQIVAGTGGGRHKPWQGAYLDKKRIKSAFSRALSYGYVLVLVEGPKVTVKWKALHREKDEETWEVLDSFSYTVSDRQEKGAIPVERPRPQEAMPAR